MKAVVYSEYGGPEALQFAHVETPAPGPNRILFKVRAAALNPVDWHFVRSAPFPVRMATGQRSYQKLLPVRPAFPFSDPDGESTSWELERSQVEHSEHFHAILETAFSS
jgi:hypothetical protein